MRPGAKEIGDFGKPMIDLQVLKASSRVSNWRGVAFPSLLESAEDERREMELSENLQRKDLTAYEQARELVRKAPVVAAAIPSNFEGIPRRGEPQQYAAPKREVAEALGVSVGSLVQAEQHVATADAYPAMQQADWKQSHVLGAREALERLTYETLRLARWRGGGMIALVGAGRRGGGKRAVSVEARFCRDHLPLRRDALPLLASEALPY